MDALQIRVHGAANLPTLIYLPGLHGDWTLVSSFRAAVAGRVRFVEFTYPRSLTTSAAGHAAAMEAVLAERGITGGWLLAESFGSQIAWEFLRNERGAGATFQPQGLMLAGGFVRHPWPWGARLLQWLPRHLPGAATKGFLRLYEAYASFRHRSAPETKAGIAEFVTHRLAPGDAEAMAARLECVIRNDPRPIAAATRLPVFFLGGAVDPLVPWPYVRWWLRWHCPGYRGGAVIWNADHNVLATQPGRAASLVLEWMGANTR